MNEVTQEITMWTNENEVIFEEIEHCAWGREKAVRPAALNRRCIFGCVLYGSHSAQKDTTFPESDPSFGSDVDVADATIDWRRLSRRSSTTSASVLLLAVSLFMCEAGYASSDSARPPHAGRQIEDGSSMAVTADRRPNGKADLLATRAILAELALPVLRDRVNDYAGLLTQAEQDHLEYRLAEFESQTTHQIAILTVASLKGEDIAAYSLRVARAWGLGRKEYNDGILVTVAAGDRRIRIELGIGMEPYISNDLAKSIIDSKIRPALRKGQYAKALEDGLDLLMAAARHYRIEPKRAR